jgi:hypothetical protein
MRFYLFPKYKTLISDTQADILLVYLVDTINQHYTLFWQKKKRLCSRNHFKFFRISCIALILCLIARKNVAENGRGVQILGAAIMMLTGQMYQEPRNYDYSQNLGLTDTHWSRSEQRSILYYYVTTPHVYMTTRITLPFTQQTT